MKAFFTPENFYDGKAILSVDFQRGHSCYRLAIGSVNSEVSVWQIVVGEGTVNFKGCPSLTGHNSAVNVLRFSNSGKFLASGDCLGTVYIWSCAEGNDDREKVAVAHRNEPSSDEEPKWRRVKTLLCDYVNAHSLVKDVTDLSWSSSDDVLATTSMNGSVILWSMRTGSPCRVWKFGSDWGSSVTCHPSGKLIVVMTRDGGLSVLTTASKHRCIVKRSLLRMPTDGKLEMSTLFDPDSTKTMKNTLSFSPDGNLLVVPNGKIRGKDGTGFRYVSFMWLTHKLKAPFCVIPSPQRTVFARFCPVTFQLRRCKAESMVKLDYKFVYAILTHETVFLYDTEHTRPIGRIAGCHGAPLTDVTFSDDGRFLVTSSVDGYLTFVSLQKDELGVPMDPVRWTKFKSVLSKQPNVPRPISSYMSKPRSADAGQLSPVATTSKASSSRIDEKHSHEVKSGKKTGNAHGATGSKRVAPEVISNEQTDNSKKSEKHEAEPSPLKNAKKLRRITLE